MCPQYMCILLYVKLMWCSGIPQIYGQLEEGPWSMCILLYVKRKWCSGILQIYGQLEGAYICPGYMCILLYVNPLHLVVFHISMVNWRRTPRYMCILLLYMKLIWCSGIPQIYDQLEEGSLVYVHSAICETYAVQ